MIGAGRINEYWFSDTSEAGVAPELLQERGVVVADTFDGDELCFDPPIRRRCSCCLG